MSGAIECRLEKNRVQELECIVKPALDLIVKYIKDIDNGDRGIGPRFENPKDLYKLLNLDDLDALFAKSIQRDSADANAEILAVFEQVLDNSVATWHPGFMDKLYVGTNPIGILSDLLLSILNTNSHVFTVSPALSAIERKVAIKYAKMFGFDGKYAGGLTFSGGSWSNITSMQIARSYKYPDTKLEGNGKYRFAIFTSAHCHYSIEKSAILLGLGAKSVFKVPVNERGELCPIQLEERIMKAISDGYTPLYINATAGTTVFGSFDPLLELSVVAKKYNMWLHVDGSWGGNVIFSSEQGYRLKGSHLVDSITASPHKMLGVPTTCSFLLVPDERVFIQANSLDAPYLFHNARDDEENFDLANGTMGCGRRADALKLYLSWLYYGQQGFQERIDHSYKITKYFVEQLQEKADFILVNNFPTPCLQVCFYYNPSGKKLTGSEMTHLTRGVAKKLHTDGDFLVDFAPNPNDALTGENNGEFFRVVFNSPNITSTLVDKLIERIVTLGSINL
jgi:glutamate decarboxylase